MAVNAVTNRIYLPDYESDNVTVIDGATNATSTVSAGIDPIAVAGNPVSNKIYVVNVNSNNVTVIDGATNGTTAVSAGTSPKAVAVNPVSNKIYVANNWSNNVTVIDGATNSTTTVSAGSGPFAVAVNPATNKIYVANKIDDTVTVIDEQQVQPIPLEADITAIAPATVLFLRLSSRAGMGSAAGEALARTTGAERRQQGQRNLASPAAIEPAHIVPTYYTRSFRLAKFNLRTTRGGRESGARRSWRRAVLSSSMRMKGVEVEFHQLALRYERLKAVRPEAERRLLASLAEVSQ